MRRPVHRPAAEPEPLPRALVDARRGETEDVKGKGRADVASRNGAGAQLERAP